MNKAQLFSVNCCRSAQLRRQRVALCNTQKVKTMTFNRGETIIIGIKCLPSSDISQYNIYIITIVELVYLYIVFYQDTVGLTDLRTIGKQLKLKRKQMYHKIVTKKRVSIIETKNISELLLQDYCIYHHLQKYNYITQQNSRNYRKVVSQ